jgi:hypothetical protein
MLHAIADSGETMREFVLAAIHGELERRGVRAEAEPKVKAVARRKREPMPEVNGGAEIRSPFIHAEEKPVAPDPGFDAEGEPIPPKPIAQMNDAELVRWGNKRDALIAARKGSK